MGLRRIQVLLFTTSLERNSQSGKKWSKKFVLDSLMILFSSFFGNTCVQKDKISNLILIKKTFFVKESIIHLLTKIEFDGEKVPKTYENEFWNRHNAKDWRIFTVFLVTAKPYKNQYKKAKPWGCISHQSNNYIIILTLLMGRSHQQLSNGGLIISRRRL